MNYYQSLGYLVLGSRLKRLSEVFLSEINKAYRAEGIVFETTWFPVFYLLSENNSLSIQELCEQIEVTHPAASQLISNLKSKGLVAATTSKEDARKQLIKLTPEGKKLLKKILPVWDAIRETMEEVAGGGSESHAILNTLTTLEEAFKSTNIVKSITEKIHQPINTTVHE
ncbi:MarR family winged helix-turn-helix transcriptional regulator [Pedobacter sp. L105]|uniref:MarR family winged helix-turn-helix transcriptional regulator n=1 Tax=Pedobacter sp. L105 TaxID=1641871 RepID=UPI00131BBF6A|nr:MarR family transcriptional regulator [Pedobacter sp. L105]